MSDIEQEIQSSPAASYWLKEQVKCLGFRDPIDALKDAEVLLDWARFNAKRALGMR